MKTVVGAEAQKAQIEYGIARGREGLAQAHRGIETHKKLARTFLESINGFKQAEYRMAKGEDPIIPPYAGTLTAPSLENLSKGQKLLELVEEFRGKHGISCPETIFQTDRVIADAYDFIESLMGVVGYARDEDEADED